MLLGKTLLVRLTRSHLGDLLRHPMLGYKVGILAPAGPLSKSVGLRVDKRHVLHNGPLECRLLEFSISEEAPQVY